MDSGVGGLVSVPIIDYREYRDLIADPHDSVRSEIMRARLIAANGTAANQIILVGPQEPTYVGGVFASMQADVLLLMDQAAREYCPRQLVERQSGQEGCAE